MHEKHPRILPKVRGKFKCATIVIIHLNDAHHWSRNAIANVVEVLEANVGVQDSQDHNRFPWMSAVCALAMKKLTDLVGWLAAKKRRVRRALRRALVVGATATTDHATALTNFEQAEREARAIYEGLKALQTRNVERACLMDLESPVCQVLSPDWHV